MINHIVVKREGKDAIVIVSSIVSITECYLDDTRFISTIDGECLKTTTKLKDIIKQLKNPCKEPCA
jgi:hypothetical protein